MKAPDQVPIWAPDSSLPRPQERTLDGAGARSIGAYYTPDVATRFLARWAVRTTNDRVLEPSVGDGAFVRAITERTSSRDNDQLTITGVELARDTYDKLIDEGVLPAQRLINGDFLAVEPFPVDVVVGNPPYVRLRSLPAEEANRARAVAESVLGTPMASDGSLWMPFVLHSTRFIVPGGRLGLVLPLEATHVQYARPLWDFLSRNFARLRTIRVHERLFPSILQDVILLLAEGRGGSTSAVEFETYASTAHLNEGEALRRVTVEVARVHDGERVFMESLLAPELVELLRSRIYPETALVSSIAAFNIGYVSGDKRFFHPTSCDITAFGLPKSSLVATLSSGRQLRSSGLSTQGLPEVRLFRPPADPARLSAGDRAYIKLGEEGGVSGRYKCRVRSPWYVTPDVRIPDLILPTFSATPRLLVNEAGLAGSNSFLGGYLKSNTPSGFAASWYTSLTLLEAELRVHSLGGGVMVMIPGEVGTMRVINPIADDAHLLQVDAHLRAGRVEEAYAAGDDAVLGRRVGLSPDEIQLIRDGVSGLRFWRDRRDA